MDAIDYPGEYEMQHVFVELLTDQSLQFFSSISHFVLNALVGSADDKQSSSTTVVQNAEEVL